MLFLEEGTSFHFHGVWTLRNGSKEKYVFNEKAEVIEEAARAHPDHSREKSLVNWQILQSMLISAKGFRQQEY